MIVDGQLNELLGGGVASQELQPVRHVPKALEREAFDLVEIRHEGGECLAVDLLSESLEADHGDSTRPAPLMNPPRSSSSAPRDRRHRR